MSVGDKKNTGFKLVLSDLFLGKGGKKTKEPEQQRIVPSSKSSRTLSDLDIHRGRDYIRAQWGLRDRLYSHSLEIYSQIFNKKTAHIYTLHPEGIEAIRGLSTDEDLDMLKKYLLEKDLESRYDNNLGLYPIALQISHERGLQRHEKEGLIFINRVFQLNFSVEEKLKLKK